MSTELENQVSILKQELSEAKVANEALKEKVVAEQKAEFESQISNLESSLAEKQEEVAKATEQAEEFKSSIESLNESLAKKEEELKDKEEAMMEKDKKLATMKKKEAMMKRKAQLSEIGFSDEDCEATIATFEDVSEEIFENIVATMKKKAEMPDFIKKKVEEKKEDEDKEDEDDKSKASDEEEALDVEAEAVESSEASLQNLDNQEEEADALRAYASNWFETSVLKSTQNLKEGE